MKPKLIIGLCTLIFIIGCGEDIVCPQITNNCSTQINNTVTHTTITEVQEVIKEVYIQNCTNQTYTQKYVLGLVNQIKRLEIENDNYILQNTTTLCEDVLDKLNNCELKMNKTLEIWD